jgi:hypothetical protein
VAKILFHKVIVKYIRKGISYDRINVERNREIFPSSYAGNRGRLQWLKVFI